MVIDTDILTEAIKSSICNLICESFGANMSIPFELCQSLVEKVIYMNKRGITQDLYQSSDKYRAFLPNILFIEIADEKYVHGLASMSRDGNFLRVSKTAIENFSKDKLSGVIYHELTHRIQIANNRRDLTFSNAQLNLRYFSPSDYVHFLSYSMSNVEVEAKLSQCYYLIKSHIAENQEKYKTFDKSSMIKILHNIAEDAKVSSIKYCIQKLGYEINNGYHNRAILSTFRSASRMDNTDIKNGLISNHKIKKELMIILNHYKSRFNKYIMDLKKIAYKAWYDVINEKEKEAFN